MYRNPTSNKRGWLRRTVLGPQANPVCSFSQGSPENRGPWVTEILNRLPTSPRRLLSSTLGEAQTPLHSSRLGGWMRSPHRLALFFAHCGWRMARGAPSALSGTWCGHPSIHSADRERGGRVVSPAASNRKVRQPSRLLRTRRAASRTSNARA